MATIAHLSDLHFGRHDPVVVEALERTLARRRPDLVAISGDFTQRARRAQFAEAAAFVERLETAGLRVLAVPGNHDVPLYDLFRRAFAPLARYKRYIDRELCPHHEAAGLSVLGINTARSLTIKDGRVSEKQLVHICRAFADVPAESLRVLVTHHPIFEMPIEHDGSASRAVDDHADVLGAIADAGVQLMLAGHFHRTHAASARDMVDYAGPALVVQAGTATSTRLRGGEAQSFNWIESHGKDIELTVLVFDGADFKAGDGVRYACGDGHWRPV